MHVLHPSSLAVLRRMNEEQMPHTATTYVLGPDQRGPGGITIPGAPIADVETPCRLSLPTEEERIRADKTDARGRWRLLVPTSVALHAGQRVVVEGETDGVAWTQTVRVATVDPPHTGEVVRRAWCEEAT